MGLTVVRSEGYITECGLSLFECAKELVNILDNEEVDCNLGRSINALDHLVQAFNSIQQGNDISCAKKRKKEDAKE